MATKKALVVDNDFFFVEFFTDLLEKRGYEVFKAYDGKEGITQLNEHMVDLLFVDFVMPKIDGRQMIRYTRLKFPDAAFPIIAISGTIIEQLDELKEIGADYYIAKGPLEKMGRQINDFLDGLENKAFEQGQENKVLDPGMIFPRREAVDLLESVRFQRAILENSAVGILTVDKDTRVLNTNSRALEILGKRHVDVITVRVTRLFDQKKDTIRLVEALKKLVHHREIGHISFQATIDSRRILVCTSPFNYDAEMSGWIIALVELP